MANVPEFMNRLKSRSTGLKQKSADWVCARKYTIGASEISDDGTYDTWRGGSFE